MEKKMNETYWQQVTLVFYLNLLQQPTEYSLYFSDTKQTTSKVNYILKSKFFQSQFSKDKYWFLYLNLLHSEVQEGVLVADADQTLGALTAHAGAQASI